MSVKVPTTFSRVALSPSFSVSFKFAGTIDSFILTRTSA